MSFPINVRPPNQIGFLTPFVPREIGEIPLDVVVEESITHQAVVTRHPIEVASQDGVVQGTVADNAYLEPVVYTMRGVVSDLPISWRLFRSDSLTSYANATAATRSISAYQLLLEHFRKREPFTLVTPFGDLENMLFRRFSSPRDSRSKHAIVIDAELVELQIVVPEGVDATRSPEDVESEQAKTQAVSEVDRGSVSGIPVE